MALNFKPDGQGACQVHPDVHVLVDSCVGFHQVSEVINLPRIEVTTYVGEYDKAQVIQVDTEGDDAMRLRINLNDAPVWDGDPDKDEQPFVALYRAVADLEAPEGSVLDDLLGEYQADYERITGTTKPKARPIVPDLSIGLMGEYISNGGPIPMNMEFVARRVQADDHSVIVEVKGETGVVVDERKLTDGEAERVLDGVEIQGQDFGGGLVQSVTWSLGGPDHHLVLAEALQEVAEWLRFALGHKAWDYEEDGEEWQY